MMPRLRHYLIATAAAATLGCSGDRSADAASDVKSDSAAGLVVPPSEPYRPTTIEASTALVVTLVGDPAATPSPKSTAGCSNVPATTETVFWVDGLREGKPLPNERRYGLRNGPCGIEPRMQATVVGGAINVFSESGSHRLIFIRGGTTDTMQTMPFTLPGSVVTTDRLTRVAGIIEVQCAQHPAERAHVAVFDHPYFGVATTGDKVTLESVPPGDYRVMTWHDGLAAPTAVTTKVGPTGLTEIVLR